MGTWALPQTEKQAKDLQRLMAEPLLAEKASDQLYDLLGDDDLFDEIAEVSRQFGKKHDVRSLVKFSLKSFIENKENSVDPWDEEALKICKEICQLSE
jgi:hypothetical protein